MNRKRVFALLLAVCLVAAVLPVPALAEGEAPVYYCGFAEEHTHIDDCYRYLKCSMEEHTCGEECAEVKERTCGIETEVPVHETHTEQCYDADGTTLICGIELAHVHTGECTESDGIWSCSKLTAHTHIEGEGGCYTVTREACTQAHDHTEGCYEVSQEPQCGKTAHSHTDQCLVSQIKPIGDDNSPSFGDGVFVSNNNGVVTIWGEMIYTDPEWELYINIHAGDETNVGDVMGKVVLNDVDGIYDATTKNLTWHAMVIGDEYDTYWSTTWNKGYPNRDNQPAWAALYIDGEYVVRAPIPMTDVVWEDLFPAPTYTVTWLNWDGTELEKDTDVAYGTTPEYNSATPAKSATAQYTYTFAGWSTTKDGDVIETLPAVTADVTYYAVFTAKAVPTLYIYSETKLLQTGSEVLTASLMAFGGISLLAVSIWLHRKNSYGR